MKVKQISEETRKTRELILDATEKVMREEGYAAASSRRIASEAGLKSQLVHYHFGSMDDLFLALFQRFEAQSFNRHLQAMTSKNPLRELWLLSTDRRGMGLIFEFMALANHRDLIRQEIARSNEKTRSVQVALLTRVLEEANVPFDVCPPKALAVLISGAALELVSEASIGVTAAHAETYAFIEQLIQRVENKKTD